VRGGGLKNTQPLRGKKGEEAYKVNHVEQDAVEKNRIRILLRAALVVFDLPSSQRQVKRNSQLCALWVSAVNKIRQSAAQRQLWEIL
jgi:hypothetical protein